MLIPMLKENYVDKTIEELVVLRNQKLEKLKDYENKFIFSNPDPLEMFPKPSPHTIYNMDNEDLIMLTELKIKKIEGSKNTNNEYTVESAIKDYTDKFGGFPHFLFMGASDETIINAVKDALSNNKEITSNNSDGDY